MQTKTCNKCGEEKALTEFHKYKSGKYGVKGECKPCTSERMREYSSRPEVRDHKRKYYQRPEVQKRSREHGKTRRQNPEYREKRREYMSEYIKRPDVLDRKRERERETQRKMRELGLMPNRNLEITEKYATHNGESWSDAEIEFLMSSELPLIDIALELGRTYPSVSGKRHRLRKLQDSQ